MDDDVSRGKILRCGSFLKFLENRFVQPAWNCSEFAHGTITPRRGVRFSSMSILAAMRAALGVLHDLARCGGLGHEVVCNEKSSKGRFAGVSDLN